MIIVIISGSSEQMIYLFFYECFVEKINQRTFSLLQKWLAFNLKTNKRSIKLTPQKETYLYDITFCFGSFIKAFYITQLPIVVIE